MYSFSQVPCHMKRCVGLFCPVWCLDRSKTEFSIYWQLYLCFCVGCCRDPDRVVCWSPHFEFCRDPDRVVCWSPHFEWTLDLKKKWALGWTEILFVLITQCVNKYQFHRFHSAPRRRYSSYKICYQKKKKKKKPHRSCSSKKKKVYEFQTRLYVPGNF